ncbi:MAG: MBG domain-containing protein [Christensenellaceae bacterium]|jgi:hypothetical protein|nr:MBG domain-containing protein [Christensenellaceae bacterium]
MRVGLKMRIGNFNIHRRTSGFNKIIFAMLLLLGVIFVTTISVVTGLTTSSVMAEVKDVPSGLYNAAPANNTVAGNALYWGSSGGTYLDGGVGLQFGPNYLKTTSENPLIVSGTGNPSLRDFKASGFNSYSLAGSPFGISGVSGSNGAVLVSNIKLESETLYDSAVFKALKESDHIVNFSFDAVVKNNSTALKTFQFTLNWYSSQSASAPDITKNFSFTPTPTVESSIGRINLDFEMPKSITPIPNECFLEVLIYIQENAEFSISSPTLHATVNIDPSLRMQLRNSADITITGVNRAPVTFTPSATAWDLSAYPVKPGDSITISTYVYLYGNNPTRYTFKDSYPYIFGLTKLSGVQKFIGKRVGQTMSEFDLTNPSGVSYRTGVDGLQGVPISKYSESMQVGENNRTIYNTTFIVGTTSNAQLNSFTLLPQIIIGIDENGEYIRTEPTKNPYKFFVDFVSPNTPALQLDSGLGLAIASNLWYTETKSPQTKLASISHIHTTVEYVYAFIFPSYITSIDISKYNLSDYQSTFDNNTDGTWTGIEIDTTLNGMYAAGYLQRITTYGTSSNTPTSVRNINFPDDNSEYSLFLITVDIPGNMSIVSSYTANNNMPVKIDSSYKEISVRINVGDVGVSVIEEKGKLRLYYIIGESLHTLGEDGTYVPTGSPSRYMTTSYVNGAAKRNELISVMFVFDVAAYRYFRFESYINYANEDIAHSAPTLTQSGSDWFLYMTYRMDDDNGEGCYIECTIREKVEISLSQRNFVYTGSPISMSDYTNILPYTGKLLNNKEVLGNSISGLNASFKYYDILTASAVDYGTGVNITYNNTVYYLDSTTPLRLRVAYKLGTQSFYTTQVITRDGGYDLQIVCLEVASERTSITNAGTYWFRATEITGQTGGALRYFGSLEDNVIIEKAQSRVLSLTIDAITYGELLTKETLIYKSLASIGQATQLTEYIDFRSDPLDPNSELLKRLYKTSAGVWGEYVLKILEYYSMPNAGTHNITVEFVPFDPLSKLDGNPFTSDADIENYINQYNFYGNFYTGSKFNNGLGEYAGKHASNYSNAEISVNIVVNKAIALIELNHDSGENIFVFDGTPKTPTFKTSPVGLQYKVLYAVELAPYVYSDQTETTPTNAGIYKLSFYVFENNYTTEVNTDYITIAKKKLNVITESRYLQSTENNTNGGLTDAYIDVLDGNKIYDMFAQSLYMRLEQLTVIPADPNESLPVGITYKYAYRLIRPISGDESEDSFSTPDTLNNVNLNLNAGVYLFKIVVDTVNYSGESTIMLYHMQVNDSTQGGNRSINFPTLRSLYAVYNIDSATPEIENFDTTIGHIQFGQTIQEIISGNQIFDLSNASVTYNTRNGRIPVTGRFLLPTEMEIMALNGLNSADLLRRQRDNALILPVRYDLNGKITYYICKIIWEAGEYVDGIFVANQNFEKTGIDTRFIVARAAPDLSQITFLTITYGQTPTIHFGSPIISGALVGYNTFEYELINTVDYTLKLANEGMLPLAGISDISFSFIPQNKQQYRETVFDVEIEVLKATATMSFTDTDLLSQYGDIYRMPSVVTTPSNLKVVFSYYNNGTPININTTTLVGEYLARATIDDSNYQGVIEAPYTVSKAILEIYAPPSVLGTQTYGVSLSNLNLGSGTLKTRDGTNFIIGSFAINSELENMTEILSVGTHDVFITFTPVAFTVAGHLFSELFTVPDTLFVAVTIEKRTINIVFSDLQKTYTGSMQSMGIGFLGIVDGYDVAYELKYVNEKTGEIHYSPNNPIDAANYKVTLTINDPCYLGMAETIFAINRSEITITPLSNIFAYDDMSHPFAYAPLITGHTLSIKYIDYMSRETDVSPRIPGRYNVVTSLTDTNYSLKNPTFYLYIIPVFSQIDQNTLVQTYNMTYDVVMQFNYAGLNVNYSYSNQNTPNDYFDDFSNTGAGVYNIRATVTINGLSCYLFPIFVEPVGGGVTSVYTRATIVGIEENYPLYNVNVIETDDYIIEHTTVLVAKASLSITHELEYHYVYTGSPYRASDARISVAVADVTFIYTYATLVNGEQYGPILNQATTAGEYYFFFAVDHPNYYGNSRAKLIINKATPVALHAPTFATRYSYGDSPTTITFKNDGVILFADVNIASNGSWSVITQYFDKLPVGTYDNVAFEFIPDNTSLNAAYVSGIATIYKKDITNDIRYDTIDLLQEYNRAQHRLTVYFSPGAEEIYKKNDRNISLIVTYNASQYAPEVCGNYNIIITVDSNCYEGSLGVQGGGLEGIIMIINPATPRISAPTLTPIFKGEIIGNSIISGGYGYIVNANSQDASHTVDGTFYFISPSIVMTKLNYREVAMTFMPDDTLNYNFVSFGTSLMIRSNDNSAINYSIGTVTASQIIFGEPLSASILSIEGGSNPLVIPGTVEWIYPRSIVRNDDKPFYRFTPAKTVDTQKSDGSLYYDNYQLIEKEIDNGIVVGVANFKIDNLDDITKTYATVYVGETLEQAKTRLVLKLLNAKTNNEVFDYNQTVTVGDYGIPLNTVITTAHITSGQPLDIKLVFSKADYVTTEFRVLVRIRHLIAPINFNVSRNSKDYDGVIYQSDIAFLSGIGISVAGTNIEQSLEGYRIDSILRNNSEVDHIVEAGNYVVSVTYDDGINFGTFKFSYAVNKRNISGAIKLPSGGEKLTLEYGSLSDTFELVFNEYVGGELKEYDPSEILPYLTFIYYDDNSKTSGYGSTVPPNAGTYFVEVLLVASNPKFSGSATFIYEILRKSVNIRFSNANGYTYSYGQSISIIPVIDISDAADQYYLTYDDKLMQPNNAGIYSVVAYVNTKNFYGQSEPVGLVIEKATMIIVDNPTVTGLVYGQNLGSAKINGGTVMDSKTGAILPGRFSFMNPETAGFTAGTENTIYLKCEINDNYESLLSITSTVWVEKAITDITIIKETAIYTGGELAPVVSANTAYLVTFVMIFYRPGTNIAVQPISAGTYTVTVRINDDNYEGQITGLQFTILPVMLKRVVAPEVATIRYGQSLSGSTFAGGAAYYLNDNDATTGRFVFTAPALVPGIAEYVGVAGENDVGKYRVSYQFIPSDNHNYEQWTGEIDIVVRKASVTIAVSDNTFTYGQAISAPSFTTVPGGITPSNAGFIASGLEGRIVNAGTYGFTATIVHDYYTGSLVYNIVVTKQAISFNYVDSSGSSVDRYQTVYNAPISAKISISIDRIVTVDGKNATVIAQELESNVLYAHAQKGVANAIATFIAPTKVGEYTVTASLANNNYYIRAEDAVIDYIVNKATVTRIEFDAETLSNQVYGSVSTPIINVAPSGVLYEILFDNQPFLPSVAGDHNILVIITDPNYVATTAQSRFRISQRNITIESIKVSNKVFDGTSSISITGTLKGILKNDEVNLTMTARTQNGKSETGEHNVEITSWALSGLHAKNYTISEPPLYLEKVNITKIRVDDTSENNLGYVTSNSGFNDNITISVREVFAQQNPTTIWSAVLGQRAVVRSVSLKENGNTKVLDEKVKFFVLLPEKYRNSKNLSFTAIGDLANQPIAFEIEGDYVTYYADRSGEILITAHDFPYWLIIAGGVLLLTVSLFVFIKVMPARKRYKTSSKFRKAQGLYAYSKKHKESQINSIIERQRRKKAADEYYFD